MKEKVLDLLEEVCDDDVVREDLVWIYLRKNLWIH